VFKASLPECAGERCVWKCSEYDDHLANERIFWVQGAGEYLLLDVKNEALDSTTSGNQVPSGDLGVAHGGLIDAHRNVIVAFSVHEKVRWA
jgi:hypothetical protein